MFTEAITFYDIKGQAYAKRALQIAIAGNHPVLLIGPEETGKGALIAAAASHGFTHIEARTSCNCGNFGSVLRECICPTEAIRYWHNETRRKSASVDMAIEVPEVPYKEFSAKPRDEWDQLIRDSKAFVADHQGWTSTALDDACERVVEMASRRLGLSVKRYQRMIRVARTIATVDGAEKLKAKHLAEACQFISFGIAQPKPKA